MIRVFCLCNTGAEWLVWKQEYGLVDYKRVKKKGEENKGEEAVLFLNYSRLKYVKCKDKLSMV